MILPTKSLVLALALIGALPAQNPRARALGIPFDGTPGPNNAITDVSGMSIEMYRSGSNASGSLTLSNLAANGVPAPGAIALLGAAGLVGSRRRRS